VELVVTDDSPQISLVTTRLVSICKKQGSAVPAWPWHYR